MRRKAGPGTWLAARWKRTPGRIRNRLGQTTWRRRDRRSTTLEPKHPTRAQSPRGREAQRPENHGSKSPETGTGDRRTSRCCENVQDAAEHSTPCVVPRSPPEPAKARPWPKSPQAPEPPGARAKAAATARGMPEVRTLQNARRPQKTRQLSLAPRSPEAERIADLPCNPDATGIQTSPRKCSRPIPRIRGTKRGKNLALN